jgi:hypothetical protein
MAFGVIATTVMLSFGTAPGEVLVQVGAGGVVPSVDAGGTVESRGHTLGHMSVQLASGSEQALVLGDAITQTLVSFAIPSGDPATTEI